MKINFYHIEEIITYDKDDHQSNLNFLLLMGDRVLVSSDDNNIVIIRDIS